MYDDKTFLKEMKNYIKNKNGLDKTQIIYDKDNTEIGSILSINCNIK